jgi:hypothetical protein
VTSGKLDCKNSCCFNPSTGKVFLNGEEAKAEAINAVMKGSVITIEV